jgi:hypothetical protein
MYAISPALKTGANYKKNPICKRMSAQI